MSLARLRGETVDVRLWTPVEQVESQALTQLRNIASLPWVAHVAVMPDVHFGKGATVGSVIAMRGAVSPAAVGVDIGCGMGAVRTSLTASDLPESLRAIRSDLEDAIPVGFAAHDGAVKPQDARLRADVTELLEGFDGLDPSVKDLRGRARAQLGTLGGGNHFIELCLDTGWPGLADAALGLAEHRQDARRGAHGAGAEAGAQPRARRPRPGGLPRRDGGDGRVPAGPLLGAALRDAQPETDVRAVRPGGPGALPGGPLRRPGALPPQLRRRGDALRRGAARHPQGRHLGARGAARGHPRLDGDAGATSSAASGTPSRCTRPRTARGGGCRAARPGVSSA